MQITKNTPSIPNRQSPISNLIRFLSQNPELLERGLSKPEIRVVFIDNRKKYTEFYRVLVISNSFGRAHKQYYWIRIVKNKPAETIREVLRKQYGIMEKAYAFFKEREENRNLHLSCAKPALLCLEFNALVMCECAGQLFNSYLRRIIPLTRKETIIEYCYNIGVWLALFHRCFTVNTGTEAEIRMYSDRFHEKYGCYPQSKLQYITYCHNDFSPRNIFVEKDTVEVIDFVPVERGFPEEDIHFFCNYVMKARFNMLYSKKFKKIMITSFQEGYEASCPIDNNFKGLS